MSCELKHPAAFTLAVTPLKGKARAGVLLTRSVGSGTIKVRAAPVAASQAAEIQLFVASKASVADTDAEHVDGDIVVKSILDVVEPTCLASAFSRGQQQCQCSASQLLPHLHQS